MDTTQYTLDLEGARKYFADLTEMLDIFNDMEGFVLSQRGKTIDNLKDARKFELAVQIGISASLSEVAMNYMEAGISFVKEQLDSLRDDKEEDMQQDRDNE